jgi:hypothetical protein
MHGEYANFLLPQHGCDHLTFVAGLCSLASDIRTLPPPQFRRGSEAVPLSPFVAVIAYLPNNQKRGMMKWGIERSKFITRMSATPVCGSLVRRLDDKFLRVKYDVNWRWGRNPASRRSFHKFPTNLDPLQQRLVDELHATGLTKCHIDELFPGGYMWRSLTTEMAAFNASDEVQSVVKKRQQDFTQTQDFSAVEHYIITKYSQDYKPVIGANNPLLRFGLDARILDVVNCYLGLWSKMIYFDMWHTLPLNTNMRFASQRWHRDPEDRRKIRTFLYFSKVDAEAGAMEYLLGSHAGGPYETLFKWSDPLAMPYPPDGEIERQVATSHRTMLEGTPGTLFFCDTAGFHRGGVSRSIPRILTTSAYVTPASLHRRRFEIDDSIREAPWSESARFAVM